MREKRNVKTWAERHDISIRILWFEVTKRQPKLVKAREGIYWEFIRGLQIPLGAGEPRMVVVKGA